MSRQRGFTLLELLVVMVVVAILAAIAVSAYTEQVKKSRRSTAVSEIGQLQLQLERWRAENPCYGRTAPGGSASGCSTFVESGTYPSRMPTDSTTDTYYTLALTGTSMTTTYTLTATLKSNTAQSNDRCGTLTATGNAKPTWAGANCN
jgi:type IV pilus assembly protein PilE